MDIRVPSPAPAITPSIAEKAITRPTFVPVAAAAPPLNARPAPTAKGTVCKKYMAYGSLPTSTRKVSVSRRVQLDQPL